MLRLHLQIRAAMAELATHKEQVQTRVGRCVLKSVAGMLVGNFVKSICTGFQWCVGIRPLCHEGKKRQIKVLEGTIKGLALFVLILSCFCNNIPVW